MRHKPARSPGLRELHTIRSAKCHLQFKVISKQQNHLSFTASSVNPISFFTKYLTLEGGHGYAF